MAIEHEADVLNATAHEMLDVADHVKAILNDVDAILSRGDNGEAETRTLMREMLMTTRLQLLSASVSNFSVARRLKPEKRFH
jgi:hypothetical protein